MIRFAALATAAALAASAHGAIINIDVTINGAQEVPVRDTPATGQALVVFNDATGEVTISGSFQNLTTGVTVAHLHGFAAPGFNAPPIIDLTLSQVGATSGTFSGQGTIAAANIDEFLAGLTYINIHSQQFTPGEIRGQVIVPAPAAALPLLGLAMLRRRR